MRKDGIGHYCNSSFQFFLIDLKFSQEEPYIDPSFEDCQVYMEAFAETCK